MWKKKWSNWQLLSGAECGVDSLQIDYGNNWFLNFNEELEVELEKQKIVKKEGNLGFSTFNHKRIKNKGRDDK